MSMTFTDTLDAISHGAAAVYHRALQAEPAVARWTTDHPDLQPLLREGVGVASGLLAKFAPGAGSVAAIAVGDLLPALKLLAARDATVPSALPLSHSDD